MAVNGMEEVRIYRYTDTVKRDLTNAKAQGRSNLGTARQGTPQH
jgi:hypothetical protein